MKGGLSSVLRTELAFYGFDDLSVISACCLGCSCRSHICLSSTSYNNYYSGGYWQEY